MRTSPFRIRTEVTALSNHDADPGAIMPQEGEWVRGASGLIRLQKKIAEGGEGIVYSASTSGKAAKIYKPGFCTSLRKEKVRLLTDKCLSCPGICFPEEILYDLKGHFVGFLMDMAEGKSLAVTVMNPILLRKKFPDWEEQDDVQLCRTILEKVQYLHRMGIIMGDVNQGNILIKDPTTVYFVDTDSYQVEDLPCPVGKDDFTAPELFADGRVDFSKTLRTMDQDNYAISILLFEILIHGKSPYTVAGNHAAQKGTRLFPYRVDGIKTDAVPIGSWNDYWSGLPDSVREAFYSTFSSGEKHNVPGQRLTEAEWLAIFGQCPEKKAQITWLLSLLKVGFNTAVGISIGAHICYFLRLAGYALPAFG